ncbi:unnamed protein product, partial [marine sediment metagenome]
MRDKYPEHKLAIVGDLFDTGSNIERTLRQHPNVCGSVFRKPMTVIPGNHDGDLSWLWCFGSYVFPSEFVVTLNGERTLLTHGHQFDQYNKPGAITGKHLS